VDITRLARATDADAIARVQYDSWMERVPQVLEHISVQEIETAWASTISAGDGRSGRVLVVERSGQVEGYCAVMFDLDVEICQVVGLEVSPNSRRSTLGIRLTNAAADLAMSAGMDEMTAWLGRDETAAQHLLQSAGWTLTGATRTVAMATATESLAQERNEIEFLVSLTEPL